MPRQSIQYDIITCTFRRLWPLFMVKLLLFGKWRSLQCHAIFQGGRALDGSRNGLHHRARSLADRGKEAKAAKLGREKREDGRKLCAVNRFPRRRQDREREGRRQIYTSSSSRKKGGTFRDECSRRRCGQERGGKGPISKLRPSGCEAPGRGREGRNGNFSSGLISANGDFNEGAREWKAPQRSKRRKITQQYFIFSLPPFLPLHFLYERLIFPLHLVLCGLQIHVLLLQLFHLEKRKKCLVYFAE